MLTKQYGPTKKNFISEGSSSVKSEKKVNIGHLSKKQLKEN